MGKHDSDTKDEITRLKEALIQREAELAIINSVQQGLASHLDVQSIYDLVGEKIRKIFKAQVVMISIYDKQTNTIEHRYAIERNQRVYYPGPHPPGGFRSHIIKTGQPILENTDVAAKAARLGQPTLPGTTTPKSWLGVPMFVGKQVIGVLSLQNVDRENAFQESDVRLLQTLAASMSVALENARLWEKENLYLKSLEREFEIGREIQAGFLPDHIPQPKGWEIAASLRPAREVAGDFYDIFKLPNGRIGLVIADVCDKGLGAALFMTLFRSLLRAVSNIDFYARVKSRGSNSSEERIKKAISLTNNYIAETHGDTSMYATIFFGILDTGSGVLTYVNGGHLPPMLINRNGIKDTLKLKDTAIGAIPDINYTIRKVMIEKGDVFFAYTDGLTDMENPTGETFSEKRLISLFSGNRTLITILKHLHKQTDNFMAGAKQIDDITILALRRK